MSLPWAAQYVKKIFAHGAVLGYDGYMKLIELLKSWRYQNRLSIRGAARQIGISEGTLRRLEAGGEMSLATFLKIDGWTRKDPAD
jgi:hypothetical protein